MKATGLCGILTCVNFLLVEGDGSKRSIENRSANVSGRILYGQPAEAYDFPFIAKLHIGGTIGGGTIITNQWVLTAAHCLHGQQCSSIRIVPATWPSAGGVVPAECHSHPDYSPRSYNKYDVGLMRIDGDFFSIEGTAAIPLPPPGTSFPAGTPALTAGWGATESGGLSPNLLKAEVLVEDWYVCNKKYMDADFDCQADPNCIPISIPVRVFCTQGEGASAPGTCFGDSGGPVVINGMVAGIISFGISRGYQCTLGSPSMHTNVVDYLPWIYSFIDPTRDTSGMEVRPEE